MPAFRVFLSAVSSEFGSARDALGASLRSRDMITRVQSDFRQQASSDTTLRKLHDYIRDCSAVVCVIGKRSGALPSVAAAAPFAAMLPAGITEASYTQWEFWFARHYGRRLSIYIATDAWQADKPTPEGDRLDLQQVLVRYIVEEQDLDRDYFGNVDRLCHLVLKEDWPQELPSKLILLPYPSLGTLFKGRDAFMRRLRASLTRPGGGAAVIAGRAVHGLGGVGKTRAAVEYAWGHRADYTALALLDAETPEKLQASLAALIGPLRLSERAVSDEAARMEAALAWLNANPGWFLILDNIDTEPALDAANRLLGRLQGGHVVLTGRLARFPRGMERLDLDVLSLDDAASFLLEATVSGRHKAADDPTQARALAEELGQLALALEMAAGTIETRGLNFAAYRALWQGNRARVIGWADQKITGYHHAVAETWRTSVDQLTEAGRHLLERLAFLAPVPVPTFLLEVPVPGAEAVDAAAALDDLAAYSLVTRDVEGGTFLVHRLVQDVTRRGLDAVGTTEARLTAALGWVDTAFGGDPQDARSWWRLNLLQPHALEVTRHADAAGITERTAALMNQLGMLAESKALHAEAELLYRRALAIDEGSFDEVHPNIARDLNNLADLLRATNRLSEAEALLRRALAINEAIFDKNHPDVAVNLSNLGQVLRAANRLDEAEPITRRALAIDEAYYGTNHPTVATDINNLALLLHSTNRFSEAEPLYRRALAITEANLGHDHPTVGTALNNLGELLKETNRLHEAEPLLRQALVIDEASLGDDHPNVVRDLRNLARLLKDTGRLDEAELLYRRALAIDEASPDQDHVAIANTLCSLAVLLYATGRLGEAEPLMRRALAIDEASFGTDHPEVATDLSNLAQLLEASDRLSEAELLMRRALAIAETNFGQDHPILATALNNLARLLQATSRLDEAEPLMRHALAMLLTFQRDTGYEHPHSNTAIRNYSGLLAQMGKSETEIATAIAAVRQEAGLNQA